MRGRCDSRRLPSWKIDNATKHADRLPPAIRLLTEAHRGKMSMEDASFGLALLGARAEELHWPLNILFEGRPAQGGERGAKQGPLKMRIGTLNFEGGPGGAQNTQADAAFAQERN